MPAALWRRHILNGWLKAIDSIGHFRLASGVNVQIDNGSNLASYDWLAVAALNASEKCGRVFLAAPLRPEDIETRQRERIFWDSKNGGVAMLRERTIGVLTVDSQPLHNADKSAVVSTVCEAVQKEGLGLLDWSDDVARLQKRVDAVAEWHPEMALPDLSTEHVLSTASEWLPFYIEQNGKVLTTAAELKKINLHDALWALIPYDMQQEVDRLAPSHITVPSGSRIRVDYRKARRSTGGERAAAGMLRDAPHALCRRRKTHRAYGTPVAWIQACAADPGHGQLLEQCLF